MKRRIVQPLVVLPVALVLALTLSVVALSAQFQPVVPDIGFEIEGNAVLDQGGDFDWENAIPPAIRIPDPNSKIETDPTTFKPNSKFEDPAGWSIMPARVGPGQSELINFLVWDIPPGNLDGGRPDDHWLVLGMERIKSPGFFEMDFEYNQIAWDGSSGGLMRTPGDVLVGFELKGMPTSKKAVFKVLLLQYLPGAQPSLCSTVLVPGGEPESIDVGTDPCPPYGDSGWYYRLLADDALSAASGLVQATMNTEPFQAPWSSVDSNATPRDAFCLYQFAEAAINLTALGIEPDCANPGTVHAKSRSAPHVHSDLKDLVGPVDVSVECARLDGHKFKDTNGNGIWDTGELPLEGWEIGLSDGSVTHTDADGYYAFEDLGYGTYTVSEVCPLEGGWIQTAPAPSDPNNPYACDGVHIVELNSGNTEANGLDFGNVSRGLSPIISKDVQTSFTRTYRWTLEKTVDDPGPILLYPGDYADVEYTVVAGLDDPAYVDGDWMVEGTITIENKLGSELLLASVTDVITPGDVPVPVECDEWVIPALGSVTCAYGPVSLPDGSARTNTATVMVQDSAEELNATAPIIFDQPTTEIDAEARVTDTNWEDEQWEGPEGFDVGYEETPWVYTYPWKIWTPGNECELLRYPNTATLVTIDTGTELTDTADVQILEVCDVTMAYEDLPLELEGEQKNDWDYNDLVVHVPIKLEVSESGDLLAASFEIEQMARETNFSHAFNLQPYAEFLPCSGTYTKKVTENGVITTETGVYSPGDNFLLIVNSFEVEKLAEFLVELRIDFAGGCPRNWEVPNPVTQYHGEWLFFDPWLTVHNTGEEIHVLQPPAVEPRILTVPVDWQPPPENVPIWNVYLCVQSGDPPEFVPYWWDSGICME